MATTTPPPQNLFTPHPLTAPSPGTDHLNILNLRDVVFFSPPPAPPPPPPLPHQPPPPAAVGLGVSIFPLLPCLPNASAAAATTTLGFQVHPDSQPNRHGNDNSASNLWTFSTDRRDGADQSPGGRVVMLKVCRDCGNRAKKECVHQRCRTCCRSHGYDCPTHLRSTWVPAAKRRERQQKRDTTHGQSQSQSQSQSQAFFTGSSSSFSTGIAKKQRLEKAASAAAAAAGSSASNAATPRSFDSISRPQDANFKRSLPGKVHAPAVFRCIRVTAISDDAAEIVYQATVTISGHVFKGFLYDQGSKNPIGCVS
ncbi:hypothetical protein MLD38_038227 [Melastoma candidum]|uniref:Uncharacterized protein n=1 Tax=Melastoma candidum TaxID=119954 RepID=A0ACB9KYW5_9MYRT|nr:hypothetical protein MLD38_038227 [Melastoma candidum]